MKKTFLYVAACMIVVALLGACSKDDNSSIKVGVIAELTGDMPAVGESCKKAAEMAVQAGKRCGRYGDRRQEISRRAVYRG